MLACESETPNLKFIFYQSPKLAGVIRNRPAVHNAIANLPRQWQNIDILINNAGLSRGLDKLHEGSIDDWEEMIDTNVKGLLYASRAVIPGMLARGSGTIINIGSIAGQEVYRKGNVYCATRPPHVQVAQMVLLSTTQASTTLGHRSPSS